MEDVQVRQRKEQKDLQGRITQKKKNATKKTRKGVNDECDVLQRDLLERQKIELSLLNGSPLTDQVDRLAIDSESNAANYEGEVEDAVIDPIVKRADLKAADIESQPKDEDSPSTQNHSKKPNRQKARLARRAAEQEAQIAAAAEEAANLPDRRDQEMTEMKSQMKKHHLTETHVRPDGHCLYSACALGMPPEQVKKSGSYSQPYQNVRSATADFISKHPHDFVAFLEEPLDSYVHKIKNTAEWGGQLELQAIARAYDVRIIVLQANGRVEEIAPDGAPEGKQDVWLAYYRHSFGLGEHYNALQKVEET